MIKLLKQFFNDVHLIAHTPREIVVTLSQEDRDLISNFRRRGPNKPKAVKES